MNGVGSTSVPTTGTTSRTTSTAADHTHTITVAAAGSPENLVKNRAVYYLIRASPTGIVITSSSSGGTASLSGDLVGDLNGGGSFTLVGARAPALSTDVCTKGYTDTAISTLQSSINSAGYVTTATRWQQLAAPTSSVLLGGQKITNIANGILTNDACAYGQLTTGLNSKADSSHTHSSIQSSDATHTVGWPSNGTLRIRRTT